MLSSADTHGIAKYARTYIRDTHTHAHTKKQKVERPKCRKTQKRKRGGVRKERKKGKKKKGRKQKGGKEEEN